MTIASFANFSPFPSRRALRILLLGAVVLLLHWLTIDWLGGHIGPMGTAPTPKPAVITAQLRLDPPDPVPLAQPKPPAKPPPAAARLAMKVPTRPLPLPEPEPVAQAPLPDPVLPAMADAGDGAAAPAPSVPPAPKLAAAGAPAAPPVADVSTAPAKPPEPSTVAPHRYHVNAPAAAQFELDVKRVDADGTKWTGEGIIEWNNDGSHYSVKEEVGISVVITRVNLLVQTSEGDIDDNGVAPVTATEKRKGRAMTATHFNRDTGQITFSASEASYALPPGAQDKASVPFQLAGIGRADVNQFMGNIDIFVGEDKDASLFRFVLVGEEELDLAMGRTVTWHLSRPARPGTYSSTLDIWLAPSLGWYPVQIRNTEASGALTTQTVSKIITNDLSRK
jgi:hypothetical protein